VSSDVWDDGDYFPGKTPQSEADLYRADLAAETAQRRADRIVTRVQNKAACTKACERTWTAIMANMAPLTYR
jgi:hypothetical protein